MIDYFLKIDSVPGESHDAHHPDEIQVIDFAWGEANSAAPEGGGGGVGKVQMESFHFSAVTSKASPKLMLLCANGKHVKSAVLVARRAGHSLQEFLKFTLTDVMVSSYQIAGSTDGAPLDEVALSFAKIQIDYKPQNANGSLGAAVHGGWDLVQNKEL
jgi:type VI secretion system secreted protein Hcp